MDHGSTTPSTSTSRSASRAAAGFGRTGEGTVKRILPESHGTAIFAVAAGEFGILLCLVLLAQATFIVIRALRHSPAPRRSVPPLRHRGPGHAVRPAIGDQHGGQSTICCPPSMTPACILPGGSSMLSLAYGAAGMLHRRRERPRAEMHEGFGAPTLEYGVARHAARAARRGRHGRPSVPRRGAGCGARQAQRRGRACDRRTRRAPCRRIRRRPAVHVIPSVGHHPRPQSVFARQDRHAPGLWRRWKAWLKKLPRIKPCSRRWLRRLSEHPRLAAARRCVARYPDRDPRAERRDGPRQPDAGPEGARHRHRLCRHPQPRARARREGDAHRQSDPACGDRRQRSAIIRRARHHRDRCGFLAFGGSQGRAA